MIFEMVLPPSEPAANKLTTLALPYGVVGTITPCALGYSVVKLLLVVVPLLDDTAVYKLVEFPDMFSPYLMLYWRYCLGCHTEVSRV